MAQINVTQFAKEPGLLPTMLIEQLQNIQRMVGGADQKVGPEAVRRFDDVMKELRSIEAAVK